MSALGQSAHVGVMSALPPKAHMKRTQAVSSVHRLFLADLFPSSVIHPCPLYPQKRTLELSRGMSALCQKRTKCSAANSGYSITSSAPAISVGGPECLRRLEVDDQFESG